MAAGRRVQAQVGHRSNNMMNFNGILLLSREVTRCRAQSFRLPLAPWGHETSAWR
jgi:hypothetical protein